MGEDSRVVIHHWGIGIVDGDCGHHPAPLPLVASIGWVPKKIPEGVASEADLWYNAFGVKVLAR